MNSLMKHIPFLSIILLLGACGAADEPKLSPEPETVELTSTDLKKADSAAWSLRVGKFHLELDPRLRATHTRGRVYYKLRGLSSRDLASVKATQRNGLVRSSTLKSARAFEIALGDEGMTHVLAGQPLFIELTTSDGSAITARLTVAPRFVAQRGFSQLFLHESLVPVRVGAAMVLRGRYQLPEGHELFQAFTDDDAEILITHESGGGTIDLSPFAVMLAADRPEDPIYLDSFDGAETYSRSTASLLVEVDSFGLTDGDPLEVWPEPTCAPQTAECLLDRERGELDTERCGLAPQVDACIGEIVAPPASDPARFAADLRRELWRRYAAEDPMTTVPGARAVDDAVRMVDESLVQYVGPDAAGLERFEASHVDVWRHRDPITSGQEGHWYGAYDYEGRLLKMWRR